MSIIKEIMESKMAKRYLAIVGGIIGLIILVIIIASIVSSCNSSKNDEFNNKEAIKKNATTELQETTEESTTDNRPQINPFDYFSIKVRYYDSEYDENEEEEYGDYENVEEKYGDDLIYVYFKHREEKDKKEEFEDIDFEVKDAESGETYDKTSKGGFVVPNSSKVTILVSEESKDEYLKYHFVPDRKTMTVEGPKKITSVRDIGSYKSKKLNYLKKIVRKEIRKKEDVVNNVRYVGYYYFKPDSDYEDPDSETKRVPFLVVIFKYPDEYFSDDNYYCLKVKNPIIKKGKVTANCIQDLKDKDSYLSIVGYYYSEQRVFESYYEEGYKSYIKGKLKDYSNNIDE